MISLFNRADRADKSNTDCVDVATTSGTLMLSWLALLQAIVAIGWIVGIDTLSIAPWISLAFVGVGLASAVRSDGISATLGKKSACTALAILAISVTLATSHDFSDDGQSYQQQGILAIEGGWNPFREFEYAGPLSIWVSHYAKGPWIYAASLMAFSGNIEIGKSLGPILISCAALFSFAVLRSQFKLSKKLSVAAAFLLSFNPVSNSQLLTYYVDGQVASLLITIAMLCSAASCSHQRWLSVALVAALSLVLNIKFSAAFFVVIIVLITLIHHALQRNWTGVKRLSIHCAIGTLVALGIGFNPYLTNTLSHGHPFYPLAGEGAVNILSGFATDEFLRKPRIEKLALSLISESHNELGRNLASPSEQIRPKFPFEIRKSELKAFYKSTDVRIGGFGPLMSGALLLILIAALCAHLPLTPRTGSFPTTAAELSLIGGLLLSAALFPESWWARYTPQLWHAIVLISIFSLFKIKSDLLRLSALAALIVLALNSLLLLFLFAAHQFMQEVDYQAQVGSLQKMSRMRPLAIEIAQDSTRHRLLSEGVRYLEVGQLTCEHPQNLIGTSTRFCVPEELVNEYLPGSTALARWLGRSP